MTFGVKNMGASSLAANAGKQNRNVGKTSFSEKTLNLLAILIFSVVFAGCVESSNPAPPTDSNSNQSSETQTTTLDDGKTYNNVYANNATPLRNSADYGAYIEVIGDPGAAGAAGEAAIATDSGNNFTLGSTVTVTNNLYGGNAQATGGDGGAGGRLIGDGGAGGAATATASNNTVTSNGTVENDVYGGYAKATGGDGGDGSSLISGGGGSLVSAGGDGGAGGAATATASNNTVTSNGTVNGETYGGFAQAISGTGGSSLSANYGGDGGDAMATTNDNTVNIGGSATQVFGGLANAGAGEGGTVAAKGSTALNIKDGDGGDATAIANDNTVTIGAGASATLVFGGLANANGGDADGYSADENEPSGVGGGNGGDGAATANNNTVTINAGASATQVFGGLANAFAGAGGRTTEGGISGEDGLSTASASNNTVIINESLTFGNGVNIGELTAEGEEIITKNNTVIVGGMAVAEGPGSLNLINAQNNTVILNTTPFSDKVTSGYIIGGVTGKFGLDSDPLDIVIRPGVSDNDDLFLGNRLVANLLNHSGGDEASISLANVKQVSNFQYYDFILNSHELKNPVLTFDGNTLGAKIYFDNAQTDDTKVKTSSSISSISMPADHGYEQNDIVTLIDYGDATAYGTIANDGGTLVTGSAGTFVNPEWEITQGETAITAKLVKFESNNNSADILDGIATPMFVAQGATGEAANKVIDLVRGYLGEAPGASGDGGEGQITPFLSFYGSNLNYDDNSEIDLGGISMVGGLAYTKEMATGDMMTLSAFLSGTRAGYHIKGDVTGAYGYGDSDSLGLGLLGRYDFATASGNTPYVEGSLHLGQVETDYTSYSFSDPLTNALQKASYDATNNYYGLHLGLGYIWNLNTTNKLDFFGKYLYAHQDGSDFVVLQQSFAMADADSHRLQAGARYTHTALFEGGSALDIYGGLRYEHEFDGELNGTVEGLAIDSTDLSGSTYIGELGLGYTPAGDSNLRFDLGVQAHQGTRTGYTGNATISWSF